jgi:hypothetical protein
VKRVLPIVLVAFAASLIGLAVASAGSASTHPTLRLTDDASVTLRGTGFKDRERVRVMVATKTHASKSVTASTAGAFVVRFAGMSTSACAGFSATAVGTNGSRASFKRSPGMCAVP